MFRCVPRLAFVLYKTLDGEKLSELVTEFGLLLKFYVELIAAFPIISSTVVLACAWVQESLAERKDPLIR